MLISLSVRSNRRQLTAVLQGLVLLDSVQLSDGRHPKLYESGVRYRRERGREHWQSVEEIIAAGHGDCEDLSAWRCAELRLEGVECYAEVIRTGPRMWHAIVRFSDGSYEDPSRELGMGRKIA